MVQNRLVLRASIAALALVATLAASACGGGDGSAGASPDEYAADVCNAISAWQKDLQASANRMNAAIGSSPTPAAVKAQFVKFMDSAIAATNRMLGKVKAAGPPAVDDGEKLQRDVENALAKAEQAFTRSRDKAKTLPTEDPSAFRREAQALGTTLSREGTAIQNTFDGLADKYESKELDEAFDKQQGCKAA